MNCKKCGIEFIPEKGLISYCSLKCRNSHHRTEDSKRKTSDSMKNSEKVQITNKRLAQERIGKFRIKRIKNNCKVCGKEILTNVNLNTQYHKKCYLQISGGYKPGSGRGKQGWYKGYWCDSSWELAWVIYNLDHGIQFVRNKKSFEYTFENRIFKYYPDFIINNTYYEIKGRLDEKYETKIQNFPFELKILFKSDLAPVFEYVHKKYGKDFLKLYEGNPYHELTHDCAWCGKECRKRNKFCSRSCGAKNSMKIRYQHKYES